MHEAIIALAVTDLPFKAKPVELAVEAGRLRAKAEVDSLAFVQAIELLESKQTDTSLLVGQDVLLGYKFRDRKKGQLPVKRWYEAFITKHEL